MKLQLSFTSFKGFYLCLTFFLIKAIEGVSFVSQPNSLSVSSGDNAYFNCIIANKSSYDRIEWWHLNQNLQLSVDHSLLSDDADHFSLFNSLTPDGQFESELQILDVRWLDKGYYKCQIIFNNTVLKQINALAVSDDTTTPLPDSTVSHGRYHANFTDCCVDEGIDSKCLSLCAPGSSEISARNFANCSAYTLSLIKCGSSQRNHVPCCIGNRVPDFCLDICQNQFPILSSSQLSTCEMYIQSLIDCFQEGSYLLPSPPTLVTAVLESDSSVRLSWHLPSQPGNERLFFRVFYKEVSAPAYRSTRLTDDLSELVGKLHSNTLYQFYVISVNRWGSSQPSYLVEINTHQDIEVASSSTDFSLLACCEEQKVNPVCRSFLCIGDVISPDPGIDLLPCYTDIDRVFQCISGMRNNTECCIRHRLSPKCYPLCDGQLSQLTFEQLDCFQEMGIISSCFQEGHVNIPGHPVNVVVDSITSSSAVVRWSLPNTGADRVIHYAVRYRKYGDPVYTMISFSGFNFTLFNLLPSTLYEVAVASVGELGTSLPSPAVVFQTYWLPGFHSNSIPPNTITLSPAESLTGCCLGMNVSLDCLKFCSYSFPPPLNSSDVFALLPCLPFANQFLHCATDGINHAGCCQSRGVKTSCLRYCLGAVSTNSYDVDCLLDIPTMVTCFQEDSLVLPSMPLELLVLNKTAYTIVLRWLPPLRNPDLVGSYIVSFRQDNVTAVWNKDSTRDRSFILQNLLPDTIYSITVVAQNEHGTSLPTPELRARTLPVDVIKKVHIAQDLTECCVSSNVSKSCLPVCGSGKIGLHECGSDLGKIIKCAADGQDHSPCCRRMNIPTHCLDFCRGVSKVDSFPSLVCVSFIEQIFTCFHEGFEKLPNPPERFSYTEVGPAYIIFSWSEPLQRTSDVLYNLYYRSHRGTNTTFSVKGLQSPYRLRNLRPFSQYDAYMVAVNEYGTSSRTETLTVTTSSDNSNQLRVEQDPEGYVAIGSQVILRCFSSGSSSVVWLHEDERTDSSVLEIDAATEDDGGRYTCVIRGSNPESEDIILKVQYAPFIELRFQSVELDSNRDHVAHLECRFFGFPDVVQWERGNGEPIQTSHANGSRYTTATYVIEDDGIVVAQLSINQVTDDDFGWYACEGSNDYASMKGYIMLTASGVTIQSGFPSFLERIESVTACCLEKQVSPGCTSACAFDIDITAIQVKRLQCVSELPKMVECSADGRNHSRCCVDKNIPSRCLSFCSGMVPVPVDVTCLAHISEIIECMERGHANLPSRPLNVTVAVDAVVLVTWLPPKSNPDLVQFYEVSYAPIVSQNAVFSQITTTSDVNFMILRNISSFMQYYVTVIAHNHHGSSVPSNKAFFTTQEPFPSPPTNVTALLIDPVSIQVTWGHPEFNWQSIALYYIYFLPEDKGNWSKMVVGQSAFESTLKGLKSRTVYRIYMTSVSSHFESSPSHEIQIQTTDSEYQSRSRQIALGVGLFFLFFTSFLIIVAVTCWCHRHHSRFKESVSFENPSYTSLGDGQICLPISQERNGSLHSSDYKAGSGSSSNSSVDAVYIENVILKEAGCQRNVGYATLPTTDISFKATGHTVTNGNNADFPNC